MDSKHDQTLLQILRDEKNIVNFLDAFFGFLYRCTDFYVESAPGQKLGFPPRVAEELAMTAFRKWKNKSRRREVESSDDSLGALRVSAEVPEPAQEVEVDSSDVHGKDYAPPVQLSDSYNGAVREKYVWSQTVSDLDVLVEIPCCVKTAKDLRVDVTATRVAVAARTSVLRENDALDERIREFRIDRDQESEWTIVFNGELTFKTRKDESVWSLVPGRHVSIHLEKSSERWWEALIVGESKIELCNIDCSRDLGDMGAAEQMKVQELMWNHQQKLLGKPTSEETKMEEILKRAWNVEGSPFKGTPYDPSVLSLN